ncbi:hypothetical protein HID58_089901 [Brassica napus]|uniref:Uncharacterized protein n=1 Tax=Brassica napus TaxID=3708 RepID=A0ABQ7Y0C4_BRANA|nr:hypothetical protein HID58_089901 [Brassica napus]
MAFLRPLQRKAMIAQENAEKRCRSWCVAGGDGTGARVRPSLLPISPNLYS